jgi:hypothetical protein
MGHGFQSEGHAACPGMTPCQPIVDESCREIWLTGIWLTGDAATGENWLKL